MRRERELQRLLQERGEAIERAEATILSLQKTAEGSEDEKKEIARLRAEVTRLLQGVEDEKCKRLNAEIKEASACKHQSSMAKNMLSAEAKIKDFEVSLAEERTARKEAERRVAELHVSAHPHSSNHLINSNNQRQTSNPTSTPPPRHIAELNSQLTNAQNSLSRVNQQLREANVRILLFDRGGLAFI